LISKGMEEGRKARKESRAGKNPPESDPKGISICVQEGKKARLAARGKKKRGVELDRRSILKEDERGEEKDYCKKCWKDCRKRGDSCWSPSVVNK